jgi:uncharacterized protein YoxC
MDVWTLNEKLKNKDVELKEVVSRVEHIEKYLKELNSKLDLINKANNEAISDKKDKPSRVRTKRPAAKKS